MSTLTGVRWREIAEDVFVRRYPELDLTVGLVLGSERALVVDTRGDEAQGMELATAVREMTELPLWVAITHGHFDHCFGTSAFGRVPVWAHRDCPRFLARTADEQRAGWSAHYRAEGRDAVADALDSTRPVIPENPVDEPVVLDLGGRRVRLVPAGRGHTDHDLIVSVPDSRLVFAGDLLENGGPPDFEDAYPHTWPECVDILLDMAPELLVAGHGEPVDADFARAQREQLATTARVCAMVRDGELDEREALDLIPFPARTATAALRRR